MHKESLRILRTFRNSPQQINEIAHDQPLTEWCQSPLSEISRKEIIQLLILSQDILRPMIETRHNDFRLTILNHFWSLKWNLSPFWSFADFTFAKTSKLDAQRDLTWLSRFSLSTTMNCRRLLPQIMVAVDCLSQRAAKGLLKGSSFSRSEAAFILVKFSSLMT